MSEPIKEIPSLMDKLYSHFIGRDIAFLFSGGLFLYIVKYPSLDFIFPEKTFQFIGFLGLSYLLGTLMGDIGDFIGRMFDKHLKNKIQRSQVESKFTLLDYYSAKDRGIIYLERVYFTYIALNAAAWSSIIAGGYKVFSAYFFENADLLNNMNIYFGLIFFIFGFILLIDSRATLGGIKEYEKELKKDSPVKVFR